MLYKIFTLITSLLVLTDAFIYPGFVENKTNIKPEVVFLFYSLFSLIYVFKRKIPLNKKIININNKVVLPTLLTIYIISLILKVKIYNNFIFTYLHFHPYYFIFILLISFLIYYSSNVPKNKNKYVYLILPISFLIIEILEHYIPNFFKPILKEDSFLEYLQFIFYALSSFFSFSALTRIKQKNILIKLTFLLLFILAFFVAGEEISWGQRIFGIKTPEKIEKINSQGEITIHNHYRFQYSVLYMSFIIIGLYGTFSRIILTNLFSKNTKILNYIKIITPPTYLYFCFLSVFIYYYCLGYLPEPFSYHDQYGSFIGRWRWQEIFETYLSIGIFIFIYKNYKKQI